MVGKPVTAAETKLGTVIDLSTVLTQELAKYTSDAGNHVHIEVRPAPAHGVFLNVRATEPDALAQEDSPQRHGFPSPRSASRH